METTPQTKSTITALWDLQKIILNTLDFNQVVQKIVDSLLTELGYLNLGYRIIVLVLADEKSGELRRISLSQTDEARKALEASAVPFHDINIPLSANENLLVKSFKDQQEYVTHYWPDLFTPVLSDDQALKNQTAAGIKTSIIYPVVVKDKTIGVLIFSLIKDEYEVSTEERELIRGFTDIVGIAVENSRLFSELDRLSTDLKFANEKLKELDARKNEFLSVAAHELRAPMTAIKGYLSMIMEGDTGEISDQTADYIKSAIQGNDRLVRLVNNMLNISRIEENRMVFQSAITSFCEVVINVSHEFESEAINKNLEYNINCPDTVNSDIVVDPDRIYEVVSNLISNAIKYTDKGKINITLSNPSIDTVRLEVADSGRGVSPEEQEKLFQKFGRIDSNVGKTIGTGLGLYVCKLLVEKFGGKIGVNSETGVGSTFWVELPLADKSKKL